MFFQISVSLSFQIERQLSDMLFFRKAIKNKIKSISYISQAWVRTRMMFEFIFNIFNASFFFFFTSLVSLEFGFDFLIDYVYLKFKAVFIVFEMMFLDGIELSPKYIDY